LKATHDGNNRLQRRLRRGFAALITRIHRPRRRLAADRRRHTRFPASIGVDPDGAPGITSCSALDHEASTDLGGAGLTLGILLRVTIGTSLVLIAIGAILKYAVTADVTGIDIQTVGVILMLIGILGLVLSLLYTFMWSDRAQRQRQADRYEEPTRRF
jgi:hypothetical protein